MITEYLMTIVFCIIMLGVGAFCTVAALPQVRTQVIQISQTAGIFYMLQTKP